MRFSDNLLLTCDVLQVTHRTHDIV